MKTNIIATYSPVMLFVLVISYLLSDPSLSKILFSLGLIGAIFVVIYPQVYFIFFILMRSSVDLMATHQVIVNINVASVITILLVFIGIMVLFKNDNLAKIKSDTFLLNINRIFLLFLLVSLFSLINTGNLVISFTAWFRLLSIIVIFNYAYLYFSGEDNFRFLTYLVLISSILPLCFGFYQFLFEVGNLRTFGFNRIYGTFLHPNVFGQYLLIVFFLVLYFISSDKANRIIRLGLCVLILLITYEIYHTFSRGVWIALFVSLISYGLSYRKLFNRVLYVAVVALLIGMAYGNIKARFMDIKYSNPYHMSSWEWRVMVWNKTVSSVKEHAIIGHGLGMYEQKFHFMAHNDHLRLGYEIGLLGLIFYLYFLCYILFKSLRNALFTEDTYEKKRNMISVCLLVALLIMSVADNLARSTVILIYMFCVLGGLLGENTVTQKNYEDSLKQ